MNEHTPLPWKIDEEDIGIIRGPGGFIADLSGVEGRYFHVRRNQKERHANAKFITKACNCHDKLLEACKAALPWVMLATADNEHKHPQSIQNAKDDLMCLKQAIAEAEKSNE